MIAGALATWVSPAARMEGHLNRQPAYDMDGWCKPGFLAEMDAEGNVTKLGRTDDALTSTAQAISVAESNPFWTSCQWCAVPP